jgi:hypothetical protein
MSHYNLFRGGIQLGTTAFDALSKKMDNNAKKAAQVAFELLQVKYPELTFQKKLNKSQIPGGIGSCAPDGGVWFYNGRVIAVFESKKQNDKGNAIERWYKNHFIIRAISATATYVTFASGKGVIVGNPIHRILHITHHGVYGTINEVKAQCNNLHCNTDGFSVEEMVSLIEQTIDASINV